MAFRSPWAKIFWMPYDDTGKHPICIRAEKFPRPEAGESQRDETSCSPHRNPRARWGECVRRRCMRSGRPLRPPLQTRLRFSRRGGLYGRPNRVPISAGDRWFHRRRGALYMRPCRTAGITEPAAEIAGLLGRIYNPPLRTSLRPSRRGRCPHRPAGFRVQRPLWAQKTPAGGRGWGDEPYCMKVPSIICWMYSWYRSCFSAGTRSLTAPADSAPFCMVP